MSETSNQVNEELRCSHCGKDFKRPNSLLKHLCERKQRWLNRDMVSSRLGYNAWLKFYETTSRTKKVRTLDDFISSNYYTAFVRWGNYCHNIDAVNPSAFLDWLLKNQVPVDQWATDTNYDRYLIQWLRTENHLDAVNRAFAWADNYSTELSIPANHCLLHGNTNRIIMAVTKGRISPWVLYHSRSGYEFLSNLIPDQERFLLPYISPENWNILFRRYPESVSEVRQVLEVAGW